MMISPTLVRILLLPTTTRAFTLSRQSHRPSTFTPVTPQFYSTTTTTTKMTTTAATTDTTPLDNTIPTYYGGDFAGHIATFSPTTGELIPIPEYYLPKTLIEWGQIPSSFESLTSETVTATVLDRVGIRVVPAVGCGVDNLDTLVRKDCAVLGGFDSDGGGGGRLPVSSAWFGTDGAVVGGKKRVLETVFVPAPSLDHAVGVGDAGVRGLCSRRVRVGVTIESVPSAAVRVSGTAPIEVTVERKTADVGSGGKVIDGGGLTGSAVFELIGENVNRPFSDGKGVGLDRLAGRWRRRSGGEEVVDRDLDGYWNESGFCTVSLPGNVIVRYGQSEEDNTFPWTVEVSLVEDEGEGNPLRRRVVQRTFDDDSSSTLQYWEEIKEAEI